ncbi:gp43A split DNA polymerase [Acinetobacter phage Ac42]|uniref:DNA polymerase n=1 Tax=Acinetobacter phage Ac42 TaxID=762660 RepID=UPI0001EBCCFA|nr:DNA polymerase [Acinetobacter phage Ac42]ADI96334.1 gp43A split DNA polymerase [Acinetobacter phage Ac42]
MNQEFYLNVELMRGEIAERYIDVDGNDKVRFVPYSPTMFVHTDRETKYKDIYGKFCLPRKFDSIAECRDWKNKNSGLVEVLGMEDFRLAYISDMYKGDIEYNKKFIRVCNMDIEVTGAEFPDPRFAAYEIDAITHYDSIDDKFYVFDLLKSQYADVSRWDPKIAALTMEEGGDAVPQELLDKVVYMPFESERELLLEYINLWEEKPPAVFTGWNVEGFDIPYVINRIKNVLGPHHIKRLSPFGKINSKTINDNYGGEREIFSILGVTILDYLDLYKKFSFTGQPTYKLDFISEYETGLNKIPYDGPINKLRETNHQRYISYNIVDVYCVQLIDIKRGFINLALSMGYYAKMNIASVMSPIKTWDAIIFNSLKETNRVLPEMKSHVRVSYPGAYVKEPKPGAYNNVMSFDLTSLYPSIIRQVNISPETIVGQFKLAPIQDYINATAPRPSDEYSCSPNGWMFRKDFKGVVPEEVEKVFFQRKEWKGKMMKAKQNAELIKKLIK